MLMEKKLEKMIQCSFLSSWVLGRPLRTRPRSEYLMRTTLQMKQKKKVLKYVTTTTFLERASN